MEIKFLNMKNILSISLLLACLSLIIGCQQPDELTSPVVRMGINSVTASFLDGTGEFTGNTPENGNEIVIPIPYYYPESSNNQVTGEMLKKMRVRANLDNNVIVDPPMLYMDLTQNNTITVTDQRKEKKQYTVRGEIRKSAACSIEEFSIPSLGLSGIINETTKTISLITIEVGEPVLAAVRLSYHATVSPDPTVVALDYDQDVKLTVTANDGVTKNVYTVKKEIPNKLPFGIRAGSAKLMFAKQLKADLGITVDNLTGGIAATNDYVIINTRNANSIYIDAKTGAKLGEFDLGPVKGSLRNFYTTADGAGNVLICNLARNDGTFKVWKLTSMTGSTELFIDWPENTTYDIGRKISVYGNLNENAIITAPLLVAWDATRTTKFARWTVVNGVLTSRIPEEVTISGLSVGWTTNCDVMPTSATNPNADYFVTYYSDNEFAWVNGTTNQVRKKLAAISTNYVSNAIDYAEFNNAKFVTLNWTNSNTWGASDIVWLLDVSNDANFSGNLETKTCPAVIWECPPNTYSFRAIDSGVANGNNTGDVALRVSKDGYYLYLYFMFTNGYVVGYQFDCVDM